MTSKDVLDLRPNDVIGYQEVMIASGRFFLQVRCPFYHPTNSVKTLKPPAGKGKGKDAYT